MNIREEIGHDIRGSLEFRILWKIHDQVQYSLIHDSNISIAVFTENIARVSR